jgi:cell division septation protein DedD
MGKLSVSALIMISIMTVAISGGHGEDIKACVGKTGQVRVVNDLSECTEDERPGIFDALIHDEMHSEEINKAKSPLSQYVLAINSNGTGSGKVILSPQGTGSGSDRASRYAKGTLVVLTAVPDENSIFAGWRGDECLGDGVCVLTMSSDKTVTALFHETNASGTVIIRNTEKSKVPSVNKKVTEYNEAKKDEKQTAEKPLQPQKPSETLYAVQAGAFRNASNAKFLRMVLAKKKYDVSILTSKSKREGEFHKVLIGKFGNKGEAEKLSRKITKMEGIKTFVTICGPGQ